MCALMFMAPHTSTALVPYMGVSVTVPSYPAQSLCTTYAEQCEYLVSVAPAAAMNCSVETSPGVALFPTHTQVPAPPPLLTTRQYCYL